MQVQAQVLNASRYDFPDEKTGEVIKGGRISYLSDIEHTDKFTGQRVAEGRLTFELFDAVKGHLPSLCDLDISLVPGKGGAVTIKVNSIKPISKK